MAHIQVRGLRILWLSSFNLKRRAHRESTLGKGFSNRCTPALRASILTKPTLAKKPFAVFDSTSAVCTVYRRCPDAARKSSHRASSRVPNPHRRRSGAVKIEVTSGASS